jgi:hypothetical protein
MSAERQTLRTLPVTVHDPVATAYEDVILAEHDFKVGPAPAEATRGVLLDRAEEGPITLEGAKRLMGYSATEEAGVPLASLDIDLMRQHDTDRRLAIHREHMFDVRHNGAEIDMSKIY